MPRRPKDRIPAQRRAFGKKTLGFTVIELLVSLSIFALLLLLVLANFRKGSYNDELRLASEQLMGGLRRMQNLAATGQAMPYLGERRVPPGGYGASFNWESKSGLESSDSDGDGEADTYYFGTVAFGYTMFSDFEKTTSRGALPPCEEDTSNQLFDRQRKTLDGDLDPQSKRNDCAGDQLVEGGYVALPSNVTVSRFRFSYPCSPDLYLYNVFDPVDITFKPPYPTPLFWGCPTSIDIELSHAKSQQCRTVTMNALTGQISTKAGPVPGKTDCNLGS